MAEKDEGAGGKEGKTRERRAAGREPGFCGDDLGGRGRGFPLRITATAAGAATTTAAGESSVPGPYDPIIPYPSHPGDWSPPNLPVRTPVRARGESSVLGTGRSLLDGASGPRDRRSRSSAGCVWARGPEAPANLPSKSSAALGPSPGGQALRLQGR